MRKQIHLKSKSPDEAGQVLISALLALMTASLMLFSSLQTLFLQSRSLNVQMDIKSNIYTAQSNIMAILNDPVAWQNTVSGSGNNLSSCMNDPAFNCQPGTWPLTLYDGNGNVYYDSNNPSYGIDSTGSVCNTYGTANPGDCQVRYNVTWSPQCAPAGNCFVPSVQLTLTLSAASQAFNGMILNIGLYGTQFVIN